MTQHEMVLAHLQAGGTLTALEAIQKFGIGRLAAVVHDLQRAGHPIVSASVAVEKANGRTVRVARYSLVAVPKGQASMFATGSPATSQEH